MLFAISAWTLLVESCPTYSKLCAFYSCRLCNSSSETKSVFQKAFSVSSKSTLKRNQELFSVHFDSVTPKEIAFTKSTKALIWKQLASDETLLTIFAFPKFWLWLSTYCPSVWWKWILLLDIFTKLNCTSNGRWVCAGICCKQDCIKSCIKSVMWIFFFYASLITRDFDQIEAEHPLYLLLS